MPTGTHGLKKEEEEEGGNLLTSNTWAARLVKYITSEACAGQVDCRIMRDVHPNLRHCLPLHWLAACVPDKELHQFRKDIFDSTFFSAFLKREGKKVSLTQ